jgi:hypothetical protein
MPDLAAQIHASCASNLVWAGWGLCTWPLSSTAPLNLAEIRLYDRSVPPEASSDVGHY